MIYLVHFTGKFYCCHMTLAFARKEEKNMEQLQNSNSLSYCVTGGAGFLGSSLIRALLLKGYNVHTTVRDPDNQIKSRPLTSIEGAEERLKIFKADLLDEGSFDLAVEGCHGVFHVASPLPLPDTSEEDFVRIARDGVLNVLRSCSRAESIKRVVYTSSVTAACPVDLDGKIDGSLDESRWTPIDFFKKQKSSSMDPIKVYYISKTLAEHAALDYAKQNNLEVVSILPSIVGGPFITSSFPMSCAQILYPLNGSEMAYEAAKYSRNVMGSFPLVHIQDTCEAHLFLMEHPHANGRYICSVASLSLSQLSCLHSQMYPNMSLKIRGNHEDDKAPFAEASSRRLEQEGFVFQHGVEKILSDCVSAAQTHGFLENGSSQGIDPFAFL